jgi:hypothetical protein
MLGLRGHKVVAVQEALVDYRSHTGALSHVGQAGVGVEAFERRVSLNANWGVQLLSLLEQYAADPSLIDPDWGRAELLAAERIRTDKALSAYQAKWLGVSFTRRLGALIRFRGHPQRRWVAARLFGLRVLIAAKKVRALIRG